MLEALVIKSTGKHYQIKNLSTDVQYIAGIRGKLKNDKLKLTNPVAVGDRVRYKMEGQDAVIMDVLPRTNYVVRQSPRKKHGLHLIASNVDQAVIITTIVEPMLKQGFIDRFLLMTEPYNIPVIIVFNKADLYNEEDLLIYGYLKEIYERIGYSVILTSTVDKIGIELLRKMLIGRITLVSGQSGVGKSTLINTLVPDLDLRTTELSDYSGKGQHTTTFAEMHFLSGGGGIIDTPGIKTLSFNHLEVLDVAHNFREFFQLSSECRFTNCTHRNEPKCAVKVALAEGRISELRYQNYLALLDEVEDQNYWERLSDY